MLKNYVMLIEEINNEVVDTYNPTVFNMNNVVDTAKNGNSTLLKQLYQATKIGIYELQISMREKTNGQEFVEETHICTPKKGRNIAKENIGLILPTKDEMIAHLVSYHNDCCEQIDMQKVSLDELKTLYKSTQSERTL